MLLLWKCASCHIVGAAAGVMVWGLKKEWMVCLNWLFEGLALFPGWLVGVERTAG